MHHVRSNNVKHCPHRREQNTGGGNGTTYNNNKTKHGMMQSKNSNAAISVGKGGGGGAGGGGNAGGASLKIIGETNDGNGACPQMPFELKVLIRDMKYLEMASEDGKPNFSRKTYDKPVSILNPVSWFTPIMRKLNGECSEKTVSKIDELCARVSKACQEFKNTIYSSELTSRITGLLSGISKLRKTYETDIHAVTGLDTSSVQLQLAKEYLDNMNMTSDDYTCVCGTGGISGGGDQGDPSFSSTSMSTTT
jgi:hypothetical protein